MSKTERSRERESEREEKRQELVYSCHLKAQKDEVKISFDIRCKEILVRDSFYFIF